MNTEKRKDPNFKREKSGNVISRPAFRTIFLFTIVVSVFADISSAQIYYVDRSGNDGNPGTPALPWKTIQRALPNYAGTGTKVVQGDTVIIRPGEYGNVSYSESGSTRNDWITYQGENPAAKPIFRSLSIVNTPRAYTKWVNIECHPNTSVASSNILTITGQSSNRTSYVQIKDSYLIHDGLSTDMQGYGINWIYTDNVTVDNCEIVGGRMCIRCWQNTNVTISNNNTHHPWNDAILVEECTNALVQGNHIHDLVPNPKSTGHEDTLAIYGNTNVVVRGNILHDASAQGLFVDDAVSGAYNSHIVIENNLIYGWFLGSPMQILKTSDVTVVNNTITATSEIACILGSTTNGARVYNNIIEGIFSNSALNTQQDYNIYEFYATWGSPAPKGPHDLDGTIVQFVDRANNNYHLTATSVARDFASALYAPAKDLEGYTRDSTPDAGCYEYGGSSGSNYPPVLDPIGNKSVNAAETLTFTVSAHDPDGDAITYSAQNLPQGAAFSAQTFTWTPASSQVGTWQVTFIAGDGELQNSQTITITVTSVTPGTGTFYIDAVNGSDTNPGTAALPWKTIQRALPDYAGSGTKVVQGNTVIIRPGQYGNVTYNQNGDAGRTDWITYKAADPNNKPVLIDLKIRNTPNAYMKWDGMRIKSLCTNRLYGFVAGAGPTANRTSYVQLLNSYVDHNNGPDADNYTLSILYADDVTVENCEIVGGEYCVIAAYSKNIVLRNLSVHDTLRDCVTFQLSDNILIENCRIYNVDLGATTAHEDCVSISDCTNVTVRKNILHDGRSQGLYFVSDFGTRNANLTIENNLIYGSFLGRPLQILDADNLTLVNNTIVAYWTGFPGLTQTGIYVGPTCDQCYIYNNIFQNTGSGFFGTNTDNRFNIHQRYNNSNLGPNSLNNAAVQFVNAAGNDYRLTDNSVAIDFGDPAHAPAADLDDLPRDSKPDAGCYEYQHAVSDANDANLVAYWKFDEQTGTTSHDYSPTGNTANLLNNTGWTAGMIDGAVQLTAADQAVVVATTGWKTAQGTIALWARADTVSTAKQFIFGHAVQPWSNRIQLYIVNANLCLGLGDSSKTKLDIQTLQTNKWYHIALSWDTGSYVLYIDGQPKATGTYTALSALTASADIGNNGNPADRTEALVGAVDEVRIYRRDLAAQEISELALMLNRPPVLQPIGDKSVDENSLLTFTVSATDPDNDPVNIQAQFLPAGATLTDQTFNWQPTYDQAGTYSVGFIATDGELEDIETITITVNNINRAPIIGLIGNKTVDENSALSFPVSAADPDGNQLTYSAQNLPAGAVFTTQLFSWTPTYEQAGEYMVSFIASDGHLQDLETVLITVNNVNRPPVLQPIGNKAVDEGNTLTFTLGAGDPDGDAINYSAQPLPTGASLQGPLFTWTPDYNQAGTYQVIFTAGDGILQASQTITIIVNNTPYSITDGLVAHWKLDEVSGLVAYDSSPTANTGTLINGPIWTAGRFQGALSLTQPNQALEVATTNWRPSQGTVALWVYANSFSNSNTKNFLFGHAAQPWSNRIQLYTRGGNLCLGLGDSSKTKLNIQSLQTNRWYHIALTWSAGKYVVYVDGLAKAGNSYTGLTTLQTYADIGNNGSRTDRDEALNGLFDDVRIYNRPLAAGELKLLADQQ